MRVATTPIILCLGNVIAFLSNFIDVRRFLPAATSRGNLLGFLYYRKFDTGISLQIRFIQLLQTIVIRKTDCFKYIFVLDVSANKCKEKP